MVVTSYYFIKEGRTLYKKLAVTVAAAAALLVILVTHPGTNVDDIVIIANSPIVTPTIPSITSTPKVVIHNTPTIEPTITPTATPNVKIYDIALSADLQQYTYEIACQYGVESYFEVIIGVMWNESRFNPKAVSRTNDYGIMQINIYNLDWLEEELGITDLFNAEQNILAGVHILAGYLHKYDVHRALMAYNYGEGGATKQWNKKVYTTKYSHAVVASAAKLIETNTIA